MWHSQKDSHLAYNDTELERYPMILPALDCTPICLKKVNKLKIWLMNRFAMAAPMPNKCC